MRMRKSEHFVRSSSSIAGSTFSVKMTDKLFETLFSSLYKFKEAAALRETLCNAIDSHGMRDRMHKMIASHYASLTPPPARFSKYLAPSNKQVEVHLPDDYEPWLEITDYGIGLPLEKIIGEPILAREDEVLLAGNVVVKEDEIPDSAEVIGVPGFSEFYEGELVFRAEDGEIIRTPGLYTTLFNSTKEDDDGQIGAYGLGSKSPFSVSDSFTVESRYEGKLYRFLMYLNANRIPTVDLVTKDLETREPAPEATDEFNGISVKVPVKNSRFRAFEEELIRLGKVMTPQMRPVVHNSTYSFQWQNISFTNRVGKTFIQGKDAGTQHFAVMGGVSYPVDITQLEHDVQAVMSKFPTSYTFFELGELNVPPSREDLSYDEFTVHNINQQYKSVVDNIMEQKMNELNLANLAGPMALYIKKTELSQVFGSGFRKMMEAKFPTDDRFHKGRFRFVDVPDAIRKGDEGVNAPFRKTPKPYSMDLFVYKSRNDTEEGLDISEVSGWVQQKQSVAIIIDNSNRARNLKIKTATANHDIVIVASVGENMLNLRNLLRNNQDAYENTKELEDYFSSWIGNEETTVDHMVFADKFVETIGVLFDPDVVYFMHDMEFVRPTVEKDPGLFKFSRSSFRFEKEYELTASDISEIIDRGERIAYIEVSGRESIHEINGRRVTSSLASEIESVMRSTFVDEGETRQNMFKQLGLYEFIVLARRKSVPMMKKFPEVFVPVDELLNILRVHNEENIKIMDYRRMDMNRINTQCMKNRMGYMEYLLKESFNGDDIEFLGAKIAFEELYEVQRSLFTEKEWHHIISVSKSKIDTKGFNIYMKLHRAFGFGNDDDTKEQQYRDRWETMREKFVRAVNVLNEYGFDGISDRRTVRNSDKRENRRRIESHRFIQFAKENYKPSSFNLIEDPNKFFEYVSKKFG